MRHYYACQSPRGFSNEYDIHVFPSRRMRDEWVRRHEHDGDVNSATMGALAITARHAKRLLQLREPYNIALRIHE